MKTLTAVTIVCTPAPPKNRPAIRHKPNTKKPPTITMIVCISFVLCSSEKLENPSTHLCARKLKHATVRDRIAAALAKENNTEKSQPVKFNIWASRESTDRKITPQVTRVARGLHVNPMAFEATARLLPGLLRPQVDFSAPAAADRETVRPPRRSKLRKSR